MRQLRLLALVLSSSILFALSLPNEIFFMGFAPLGYLALVPLYIAILELSDWRSSFLLVGLYGAAHHATSSYWLYFFQDFAFWTIGVTTLAYFLVYGFLGFCLVHLVRRSAGSRPLAFALVWTSFEYLKSSGFLGYPWGLLPYTQTTLLPLLQLAEITGVYGLSFLLAYANGIVAEFLYKPRLGTVFPALPQRSGFRVSPPPIATPGEGGPGAPTLGHQISPVRLWSRSRQPLCLALGGALIIRHALIALGLFAATLGFGLARASSPLEMKASLRTLVVQQNLNPWSEGTEAALEANMALTRQALDKAGPRPDLVLFSESSLGYPYRESAAWYMENPRKDPFLPWFRKQGVWLLTGSPVVLDWKDFSATNSVVLVDPSGRAVADYAKIHPVPFAEAIPFYEYPGFRAFLKGAVGLEAGWTMGTSYTIFSLPLRGGVLRFGAPICFEDAFAPLCRRFALEGAELLVNLTDDSWSKTRSAQYQHLAAARFRSIELRLSLIRSTNSGASCLVDPLGRISGVLPAFTATQAIYEVPIAARTRTAYLAMGDWFALVALLLSTVWTLIIVGRESRNSRRLP